ncbi:MAG: hypothetical protein ACREBW_08985, partial [Candidatus Micrarchaeaceae archaeon]
PVTSTTSQSLNAAPDWMQQFSATQTPGASPNSTADWMPQIANVESQPSQPATPLHRSEHQDEQEQHYLASLEDLEKSLQAQGFTSLAPGGLAAIAQTQQNTVAARQAEPQGMPSLSSALAQFGTFSSTAVTNETWPTTQATEPPVQVIPQEASVAANPFAALGARMAEPVPQMFAPLPATPAPMPPVHPFAPTPRREAPAQLSSPLQPTYRSDALLDSDLETTMKRPAITLQPMHHSAVQGDQPSANSQRRNDRKHGEHADDGKLSSHERLVKGYQYQLSGAYDEAMQEYRLIIRNAPELLEDVTSNLRALLKINPHFSLGYRVLGDAYMRKGEYLQAMESYNKALTMAKKAKN